MSGELSVSRTQLPPLDYWHFDPKSDKIPVPTDYRGLVDAIQAAQFLRSIIDSAYTWRLPSDRHHQYGDAEDYREDLESDFRELPINIVRLPRDAHELWHHVFLKPDKPDRELMWLMKRSFGVTTGIYRDAREVIRLERHKQRIVNGTLRARRSEFRSLISRERGIDFHKRRFEERLAIYETLPPECILEPISTSATLPKIAKCLGAAAVIKTPTPNLASLL